MPVVGWGMVVRKSAFLSINYTWYGAPEKQEEPSADVISIWHCPEPVPGAYCREIEPTIVVDLTQSLEEISSNFNAKTRQKIRQAERDHLVFSVTKTPGENDMNAIFVFHDAFREQKNLRRSRGRSRGLRRFFASFGLLRLTKVSTGDGKTLTWHAYLVTNRAAAVMADSNSDYRFSAQTAERNLVGRALRFHFWQDIRYFKEKGVPMLDFGGWYSGNTDRELLNINRFKEEFGGQVVKVYKCWYGVTMKGKLGLRCYLLLEDLRSLKRRITELTPLLTQHLSKKAPQSVLGKCEQ
jgi:hypothetical protein